MVAFLAAQFRQLLPYEPITAAWPVFTAASLGIFTYIHSRAAGENKRQRLISGLAKGLAFIGLALLVFVLLNRSYSAFNTIYASFTSGGSLSNQAWKPWHALYGEPLIQHDLEVVQWVSETQQEIIQPEKPGEPVRYADHQLPRPLELDSITGFNGHVTLNLVNPQRAQDSFNAFALTAVYEYEITNTSGRPTNAAYRFPLDKTDRTFRDIHIRVNGEEIEDWKVDFQNLRWVREMEPGQVDKIEVQYTTWGMNSYAYMLDRPREVRNFQLALAFETDDH